MPKDWRPYVSGYLDNELEPEERRAFEQEMARDPGLAKEVEAMSKLTSVMGGITLRELPDSAWDSYRARTYNRLERRIGWVLLSVGAMVLIGYGLYEFAVFLIAGAEVAWWVRVAIGAVCAGVAVLLVSVIRERLFVWKRDPYREVKR
jgi:anti-sigma factor RsiW